jgi:DNA polymerase-3 subunit gamma/tau
LGLMKLVHLQRLIPVEELLSQLTGRGGAAPSTPRAPQAAPARVSAPITAERVPAAAERPSFSPFEADRNRKRGGEEAQAQRREITEAPSPRAGVSPEAAKELEGSIAVAEAESPETPAGAFSPLVEAVSIAVEGAAESGGESLDRLRQAIVEALDAQGHQTASSLMAAGNWRMEGDTVQVRVAVKKLMLGLVMNPEADKIARGAIRELGFAARLQVVPGDGTSGPVASSAAAQGSVQAMALENPLVKQARELFRAEVRSVLDLRDKR